MENGQHRDGNCRDKHPHFGGKHQLAAIDDIAKSVPADKLKSVLGIREVAFVPATAPKLTDQTLA